MIHNKIENISIPDSIERVHEKEIPLHELSVALGFKPSSLTQMSRDLGIKTTKRPHNGSITGFVGRSQVSEIIDHYNEKRKGIGYDKEGIMDGLFGNKNGGIVCDNKESINLKSAVIVGTRSDGTKVTINIRE